jgi:hypothetical protein
VHPRERPGARCTPAASFKHRKKLCAALKSRVLSRCQIRSSYYSFINHTVRVGTITRRKASSSSSCWMHNVVLGKLLVIIIQRSDSNCLPHFVADRKSGTSFRCPNSSWSLKSGTIRAAVSVDHDRTKRGGGRNIFS